MKLPKPIARIGALATLCVVLAAIGNARAEPAGPALEPDVLQAFEWFSSLGFPDVKGLPPIKVWTGGTAESKTVEPIMEYGFLAKDDGKQFEIITTDLIEERYTASKASVRDVSRVRHEEMPLDQFVAPYLEKENGAWGGHGGRDGPYPLPREMRFIMAWSCWRHDRNDLAARLVDEARKLEWPELPDPTRIGSLRELVTPGIAAYQFQLALLAFADTRNRRQDLVNKLEAFIAHFPEAEDAKRATQLATALRDQLAEEKAYPPDDHRDVSRLPKEEQARIWVGRLRDHSWWEDKEHSPYSQLNDLGEAAVPALIESLDDYRPTRHVSFMCTWSRGWGPEQGRLSSVGDMCATILELVAPHQFKNRRASGPTVYLPSPVEPSAFRLEAREWWDARQKKGALQTMIDAVAGGGPEAKIQANQLRQRFPEQAGAVFAKYYRTLDHPTERSNLIYAGVALHDPAWIDLLKQEAKSGSTLEIKVAAAWVLRELGEDFRVEPLLTAWKRLLTKPEDPWEGGDSLVRFLASSVDEGLIRELTRDFSQRPNDVKREIMSQLADACGTQNTWNQKKPAPPEVKELLESLLASWLADDRESWGLSYIGCSDPSIGDDAARHLASLFPEKYKFNLKASLADRTAARLECQNCWRRSQGLPPMEVHTRQQVANDERNKIVEITFADENLKNSATMEAIKGLQGQTMQPEDLVRILCDFGSHLPPGVRGVKIRASRDSRPNGVSLKIWSALGKHPETWQDFEWYAGIEGAQGPVLGTCGSRSQQNVGDREEWASVLIAANKALAQPPETELVIRVGLWAKTK
jgi:hypothetical protein